MKTEREIREKIEEYMEIIRSLPWWEEEKEQRMLVLDGLLWVVDSDCGKPI